MFNKKTHSKLPAFTMLELMIGMVISSLIITMVYYIYDNLSKQVVMYTRQQNDLALYNQFQSFLSKDIRLSNTIAITDNSVALMHYNKEIKYTFLKDKIIRKAEKTIDTFGIKVLGVTLNETEKIEERYQFVKLKLNVIGTTIDFFESKEISLASRINKHFLNEH